MENNIIFDTKNDRASRGIHSQFNILSEKNKTSSDVRFEFQDEIRRGLTSYSIKKDKIEHTIVAEWNKDNVGGIPIDYDKENGTIYIDSSDAHTLLIGATGSKKSRHVAMPAVRTLAAAGESMIVCDPKAEIYNKTASALEEKGYKIGVLNFRNPLYGDAWNILSIPYKYYCTGEIDKACEFINDLTINLMPIQAKDPYWDYSSRDLLFGLTLLLFLLCKNNNRTIEEVNITSVLRLKSDLFYTTDSSIIMRSDLWRYIEKDELICKRLLGTVICPDNTMSCILSTFDQHMSCFSLQPQLVNMLSSNTLLLDNLGFERNAIFLIMPDEKTTYHKIVSVFIKEIYEYLIDLAYKKCANNSYPVRINYILDEFSSLPAIPDFPQMVTASRSRNIRFLLIVQSKHQLKERYGEETETIQSNCGNWMFLFSREVSLLDEISSLCGTKKGEPLVPIFLLQHLDKESGECLILAGRHRPYIAHLADIEVFNTGCPNPRPLLKRQIHSVYRLPPIKNLLVTMKETKSFERVTNSDIKTELEIKHGGSYSNDDSKKD